LAADEHVVSPNQESENRNGEAGHSDHLYPKIRFRVDAATSSLIHSQAGKNHDIDGRMRVEPEKVLEQHGISAQVRIEDADVTLFPARPTVGSTATTGVPEP